jgi:hypothetical protein
MQEETKKSFKLYYFFIIVLAFVFYGSSLKNGYSLDDNLVTSTENSKHPTIEKGFKAIPDIFTSHFVVNDKQSYAYRPITTSTFAIEYQLFGSNPMVSHLISILLYALSILILFAVLNQIWGEDKFILTALTCLIFLIHPLHSEVVYNIKCRDELLAFLFALLSLKNAISYYDRKKLINLVLTGVFILLSILSKKDGLIVVAIIPLVLFYFRNFNWKKAIPIAVALLIGFVLFKGMNKVLLTEQVSRVKEYFENPLYFMDFSDRLPMFFYSNYYYLSLLLLPYPLRYYYGFDQVPIADWSHPIVLISAVIMIVGGILVLRRTKKKEIWTFGIWFYLLAIGGACNLLFPAVGIIAERFAYFASLGFVITIASLLYHFLFRVDAKFKKFDGIGKLLISMICVLSFFATFNRSKAWESEMSLYAHDIEQLDRSFKAHTMLAQAYYSSAVQQFQAKAPIAQYKPNLDSSYHYLSKSLGIYDQYATTYNNLGAYFYTFKGDVDSAYYYFKNAVDLDSNYVEALFNLGNLELWQYKTNMTLFESSKNFKLDSVWNPTPIETFNPMFIELGTKLEKLRTFSPQLVQTSALNAKTEQDFLANLEATTNNAINKLALSQLFSEEDFKQRIMQNNQLIIKSYNEGNLDKDLFNFVSLDILNNFHSANTYGKVSKEQISEYAESNVYYFETNLIAHFKKSIELAPEYYPPYKGINEYYTLSKNYQEQIAFNIQASENKTFLYKHEFYEHIYKAYFLLSDADNCIKYLKLTISDLDKNIEDVLADNTQNKQEIINKQNLLPQLKTKRISTINKIIQVLKSQNKQDEVEVYTKLLNPSN